MATRGKTITEERDYYELLGVGRDAGEEEIRAAYRRRIKLAHPDLAEEGDRAELNRLAARLNEARDTLLDPRARRDYDRSRAGGSSEDPPTGEWEDEEDFWEAYRAEAEERAAERWAQWESPPWWKVALWRAGGMERLYAFLAVALGAEALIAMWAFGNIWLAPAVLLGAAGADLWAGAFTSREADEDGEPLFPRLAAGAARVEALTRPLVRGAPVALGAVVLFFAARWAVPAEMEGAVQTVATAALIAAPLAAVVAAVRALAVRVVRSKEENDGDG